MVGVEVKEEMMLHAKSCSTMVKKASWDNSTKSVPVLQI